MQLNVAYCISVGLNNVNGDPRDIFESFLQEVQCMLL